MMNRLVFSIVMCLMALTNPIWAEDKLTINDFIITPGVTDKEFLISLDNDISYAAFQFDLYLPKGMTVTSYNPDRSRLPQGTSLEMNIQPDNSYRFIAVANNLENISDTKGSIVRLTISADKSTTIGNLTGYFKNIKLSKANGEGRKYEENAFQINVVKPTIVSVTNYTRSYGDSNPIFEYRVEGDEIFGTPEIICDATEASGVGTYPIVIKKGTILNDSVTFVNSTLEITKAPLNINAGSYVKKQGDSMPEFTPIYTGFRNSDTKDVLTKLPIVSCEANEASAPGEYPITVSGAEAYNYDIKYTNGILTVTEADLVTITVKPCTRVYGDENPTFEFTTEGAPLEGVPEIICEATPTSQVGTYDIMVKQGTVSNYNVAYVKGTLTITKAPLTIAATTYTKKQGEEMPEFTLTYAGFKNDDTKDVLMKQPIAYCEANEASAPGEYPVTVSGAEARNYDISYTNGKLIVTEADVVIITAKSYTRLYGDENPIFEYTVDGADLEGTPEIVCEATALSPAGSYDIIVRQGTVGNYNVTYVAGKLTIEKAPLNIAVGDYTKKQGEPMPEFKLSYAGFKNSETEEVLTKQPVVNCIATEASAPGEYPITISGAEAENYSISYSHGRLVVIDADPVTITAKSYTREYGESNPIFEFETEGAALSGTPEIICEATATSPVGTYDIVVKQGTISNYNVAYVKGTLTITKAPLNIAATAYTKKQGEEMPPFTLSYTGFKNNETKDVLTKQPEVSCNANETSAPREYPVTVSGAEATNYDISYTNGKLIVTEADLIVITARSYTRKYGESNPSFEFTAEGGSLHGKPEITCEATETSPIGTYDIIVKQGTVNNYNVTYVAGTLTIEKALLTIATSEDCYTKKQGDPMPEFRLSYAGFKNGENEDVLTKPATLSCNANEATEPGEYPITISGAEATNYDINYNHGKLIVIDADNTIIMAKSYTRYYGDDNPVFEYSTEGAPLNGTPEITCEASTTSPVGTYDILVKVGSVKNYNVTYVAGTLTIEKAPLTISADTYTKKQGEPVPDFTLTYTGFKNGENKDVLTSAAIATCNANDASNPGEYPVRLSGAEARNYDIKYIHGKLIVTEADPVTITAKSYVRVYGDENPTFEFTTEGAPLEGTPEIVCEATATSPVGTYDISFRQGTLKNYNVTYAKGTLTIEKAPLNIATGNYTKKQGEAMPEFSLTYTGFKNNETKDILTKQASVVCGADGTSAPGEYPVTVSGAEARNYDISYTNGNLIVTEADAVIITAKSYKRQYGDANPTFEFTVDGAALEGTPEIICEATPTSSIGTYDIIVRQGTVSNYNVTYVAGTLTIEKAPLTIAVEDCTKKQGEPMPEFKLSYTGFKNNETPEVLTKQPVVNCIATEVSTPGEYPITISGAEAENYAISYRNSILVVTDADPVTITAKSYTREYGESNPIFEFETEGAALSGTPEIICEATATSPVGTYDIVVKQGTISNYNVAYVKGTLTITKAPLNIAATAYTKKQGEEMPPFTLSYTGFKNNETKDVLTQLPIVSCDANQDSAPGEYPVTLSGAEGRNYDISYTEGKLVVTEADPVIITAISCSRKYGEENPLFDYVSEGVMLDGIPEITCEATETSPVGTYDIIVKQGSVKNFNVICVAGTLTIEKAPLNIAAGTYVKKQGAQMPEFTLAYTGFMNNESQEVLTKLPSVSCDENEVTAPGEYPVVVYGAEAENYEITYTTGKLIVIKADPVIVKVKNATREYGDENPIFEYTTEGSTLTGTPEFTCDATATSPIGTYEIVAKQGTISNFNVTYVSGTLTVEKAPLTVSAGTYTKKQGDTMPEFTPTYSGFKNNEDENVLTELPTITCEATKESNPGEYAIIISGAKATNYAINHVNGKLTVTEADPVIIKAKDYARYYGNQNPVFEFTTEGAILEGTPEIECEATLASPAGTYEILVKQGSVKNYNVIYTSGTLTIEKAPLTVSVGNYTREQGQENPEFELKYWGWKNDENENVLLSKPIVSTTATQDSPIGDYLISISGGEAQNYEFEYSNGILTVIQKNNIISANANSQQLKVFTTTGKRMNVSSLKSLPRGIYIVNGQKIVIR